MYHACNPLEFSRVNGYLYPHVSNFTKAMFVLTATSVASKRVFFTVGNIISGKWECLLLRNANMSSKECACRVCDPSVHWSVPSIGFVYVCRKLSPHLTAGSQVFALLVLFLWVILHTMFSGKSLHLLCILPFGMLCLSAVCRFVVVMLIVVMMGRWFDDSVCWVVHDVRLYTVVMMFVVLWC